VSSGHAASMALTPQPTRLRSGNARWRQLFDKLG